MSEELTEFQWKKRVLKTEWQAFLNRRKGKRKVYGFLDFDGVINVFYPPGSPQYERFAKKTGDELNFADPECVARISKLCLDYDIEVIISSSWRYAGIPYCRKYLLKAGLDERVKIGGVTDDGFSGSREIKITDYLFEHPDYGEYLIFDDIDMKHLGSHQLLCKADKGYTEELDQRAREILERKGYHPHNG